LLPIIAAFETNARDLASVIADTLACRQSERSDPLGGNEDGDSLEQEKREGYS
jgi:sulfate adenylyltransferase subunit 2